MSIELLFVLAVLCAASLYAYAKRRLSKEGIFLSVILGLAIFRAGGMVPFIGIMALFALGDLVTRINNRFGKERHRKRRAKNIMANLGIGTIALLLGLGPAFWGAITAALADTASSEIGRLSKTRPVMITTLRKAKAGNNGAVTLLGFGAAFAVSLAMAGLSYFGTNSAFLLCVVALCGMVGTTVDSILGALFENRGAMDGFHVNTLCAFSGAVVAVFLSAI